VPVDSASCTKPKFEDFRTKSYCLMNYLCTPYPDELQLSMGLGNSPQLSMSTKCKTKHTRRHRKARASKFKAHAQKGPAQAPHVLAGTGYLPRQTGWQTRKRGQGTRRQVHSTRTQEGHAVQAPGQGTGRVAVAVPWHNWTPEKCDPRQWWKMALTSALLRATKIASERLRGSEI